jgi:hypothetical protein
MAQTQQFRGTARRIETSGNFRRYYYHRTAVVGVNTSNGAIRLDSGGWRTATTKLAMNQASHQDGLGFSVIQRKGDWFVNWQGKELPFTDGMVLSEEQS